MEKQEKVFRELRERFIKELVLAILNLDKNENGSGCIGLCNRKSLIYRM